MAVVDADVYSASSRSAKGGLRTVKLKALLRRVRDAVLHRPLSALLDEIKDDVLTPLRLSANLSLASGYGGNLHLVRVLDSPAPEILLGGFSSGVLSPATSDYEARGRRHCGHHSASPRGACPRAPTQPPSHLSNSPAQVVDVIPEHCALVLAGNHDAWVTGILALDLLPLPRQQVGLTGQRNELSDAQLTWLRGLPSYARRAGVELWHGSADDPLTGWIDAQETAAEHLMLQQEPIGLTGHTHRAAVGRMLRDVVTWRDAPPTDLDLIPDGRWLLNPGAVTEAGSWLELDLSARTAAWHQS